MSERIEALLALADKYPELTAVLVATVVWPTITGLVSFAQDAIKARAPRLWSVLKSSGFDALGTIRKVWPRRLPPPPAAGDEPSPPASNAPTSNASVYRVAVVYEKPAVPKMPPPPATILCALAIALTGCGASMLSTSASVANAAAEAAEAAKPVLVERCIEPMREALKSADVALARATADRCDLPIAAYDLLRRAHIALRAGIVALASGRMPTDPIALIGDVVDASQALATSIGDLK